MINNLNDDDDNNNNNINMIRVCSYNCLAQCYIKREWFPQTRDGKLLKWSERKKNLVQKIGEVNADIVCLQEIDNFDKEWKDFFLTSNKDDDDDDDDDDGTASSFGVFYKQRTQKTNKKKDGSLVSWRTEVFDFMDERAIEFNDIVLSDERVKSSSEEEKNEYERDCVAALVLLKHKVTERMIVVVSCHLYWDPKYEHVKMKQAEYLRKQIDRFVLEKCSSKSSSKSSTDYVNNSNNKLDEDIGIIVGGDFNSIPTERVYKSMIENGYKSMMKNPNEPLFTTVTPGFTETIDYIFCSSSSSSDEGKTKWIKECRPISMKSRDLLFDGCPCDGEPSDHLAISCDIVLANTTIM
jgi:CCR4-NOT transcription complex subunit 6